jgi:hypothetical protein
MRNGDLLQEIPGRSNDKGNHPRILPTVTGLITTSLFPTVIPFYLSTFAPSLPAQLPYLVRYLLTRFQPILGLQFSVTRFTCAYKDRTQNEPENIFPSVTLFSRPDWLASCCARQIVKTTVLVV